MFRKAWYSPKFVINSKYRSAEDYARLRKEWQKEFYSPHNFIGVDEAANMEDHAWDALRYMATPGWSHGLHKIKKEKKYMFFKKLWRSIEGLETSVEKHNKKISGDGVHNSSNPGLNSRVWELENKTDPEHIDCHTCGCVVRKEIAFRSHDRIEREGLPEGTISFSNVPPEYTEVVYETWYCKLHKRGKKEYGSK